MAATLRKFMDEEIFSKITKNRKDLDNTIEFLERVDKLCNEHQHLFDLDKTEPIPMTIEEEKELGIETNFGVKFDKDGNMMHLTKLQLCRQIMNCN
jgi:hypothetical protein